MATQMNLPTIDPLLELVIEDAMKCEFCQRRNGYTFFLFTICPNCARDSELSFVKSHEEILAMLDLGGAAHYLYTASTADADESSQLARLKVADRTLKLIANKG